MQKFHTSIKHEIMQAHKLEIREVNQFMRNIQSGLESQLKHSKLLNFRLLDFNTISQLKMKSISLNVTKIDIRESTEEVLDLLVK